MTAVDAEALQTFSRIDRISFVMTPEARPIFHKTVHALRSFTPLEDPGRARLEGRDCSVQRPVSEASRASDGWPPLGGLIHIHFAFFPSLSQTVPGRGTATHSKVPSYNSFIEAEAEAPPYNPCKADSLSHAKWRGSTECRPYNLPLYCLQFHIMHDEMCSLQ